MLLGIHLSEDVGILDVVGQWVNNGIMLGDIGIETNILSLAQGPLFQIILLFFNFIQIFPVLIHFLPMFPSLVLLQL